MKYSKKQIILSIVPIFALVGCSNDDEQTRYAAPNLDSRTVENSDGSLSTFSEADEQMFSSYDEAKVNGYQGSFEDWLALTKLYADSPELAEQQAESSGFNGGTALFATAAGLAMGAVAMNAMAGRSNVTYDSYSQQRTKQKAYYAQMHKRDDERSSSSSTARGGSFFSSVVRNGFGGAVGRGG